MFKEYFLISGFEFIVYFTKMPVIYRNREDLGVAVTRKKDFKKKEV